jgi:hypothetical protein
MRMERAVWAGAPLVAVLCLAGCDDRRTAEVHGTVQVDGKPLEAGAILFVPVDGKTATTGGPIKDGRYSVRVPVGTMKVSISAAKVVGMKKVYDTPDSPQRPVMEEALPERYNEKTELQIEVRPGRNQEDFNLQGR